MLRGVTHRGVNVVYSILERMSIYPCGLLWLSVFRVTLPPVARSRKAKVCKLWSTVGTIKVREPENRDNM